MIDKKAVGERIKDIRLSMGMTMKEFGEIFSANKATVNNWEKARNLPNKLNLSNIAFQGQISVDELLHGKRPDPLIEWIGEKIKDDKTVGLWDEEAEAHYNKGYTDAMLEVLSYIKLGGKEHE